MQSEIVDEEVELLRQWIGALVAHERTTASTLARARGVNPSTITRFLNGETKMLSVAALQKLAAASPVAVPNLLQKKIDLSAPTKRGHELSIFQPISEDGIPIWTALPLSRDHEFYLNTAGAEIVERPLFAKKKFKIAIFYAPDDTMAPRWRAGEPVVFDLAKPASEGDIAIIKLTNPGDKNGHDTHLFRKLGRRRNGNLEFFKLSTPDEPEHTPLERVLEVRHVLTWEDMIR